MAVSRTQLRCSSSTKRRLTLLPAEIPLLLGTVNAMRVQDLEPSAVEAQKYLQEAVVAFIKDPQHGLVDFGWPLYNPNSEFIRWLSLSSSMLLTNFASDKFGGVVPGQLAQRYICKGCCL